jgi:hypothetical protein
MLGNLTTTLEKMQGRRRMPKYIHFAWVGVYEMPEENLMRVLQWQQVNPSFDVWLWVDKVGTEEETWQAYDARFQKAKELLGCPADLKIPCVKCIEKEAISDIFIRYEIGRSQPNYGAASDLIRYKVLYEYGGAYFDSDVLRGRRSLEASGIFDVAYSCHRLYVDINSGNNREGCAGNDALICTAGNLYLRQVYELACRYYSSPISETTDLTGFTDIQPTAMQNKFGHEYCWHSLAYDYTTVNRIKELTICRTGPCCFRDIIQNKIGSNLPRVGEVCVMDDDLRSFIDLSPVPNEGLWLKNMLLQKKELFEATDAVIKEAVFVAKYMKSLWLDDYVDLLIQSSGHANYFELISHFVSALRSQTEINYDELVIVQYPYRHANPTTDSELTTFCREKGIYAKAQAILFPKQLTMSHTVLAEMVTAYRFIPIHQQETRDRPAIFAKALPYFIRGGMCFLTQAINYCETSRPQTKCDYDLILAYIRSISNVIHVYDSIKDDYAAINSAALSEFSTKLSGLQEQYKAEKETAPVDLPQSVDTAEEDAAIPEEHFVEE